MATTIQVRETTLQGLKLLKEKGNYETYDQIINELIKDKLKIKDMFGVHKDKKIEYNKKEDRDFEGMEKVLIL